MTEFLRKPESAIRNLPKVYFTCHPQDFADCFQPITDDILSRQRCVVYYLDPNTEITDRQEYESDLEGMILFVVPVTEKLLKTPNRAMDIDVSYALEHRIPVLPLMQESGLDKLFSERFGNLQYLDKNNTDRTAISFDDKLDRFLSGVIVGEELFRKVREAFDARVFLSYRKKDRKYARQLMRLIHRIPFCRDVAIWYDEFLVPGEEFTEAIRESLDRCDLFALAVTPHLFEEGNYVLKTEYPMAKELEKPVMPAELVPTDREELRKKYEGIPEVIRAEDAKGLSESLKKGLGGIELLRNNDPEHLYLMGVAYLSGIDAEVNPAYAISLLTASAKDGWLPAVEKLVDCYYNGIGVERNPEKTVFWQKKKIEILTDTGEDGNAETDAELAGACLFLGELYLFNRVGLNCEDDAAKEQFLKVIEIGRRYNNAPYSTAQRIFRYADGANRLLAVWYEERDRYAEALEHYREVYIVRKRLSDRFSDDPLYRWSLAQVLMDIGVVNAKRSDFVRAVYYLRQAIECCREGAKTDVQIAGFFAFANLQLANTLERCRRFEEALPYLDAAEGCCRRICEKDQRAYAPTLAQILFCKGLVLLGMNRPDSEIKVLWEEAMSVFESCIAYLRTSDYFSYAVCMFRLANLSNREGDPDRAASLFERSEQAVEKLLSAAKNEETLFQAAIVYLDYAAFLVSSTGAHRDVEKSLICLEKAKELFDRLRRMTGEKYREFTEETDTRIQMTRRMLQGTSAMRQEAPSADMPDLQQMMRYSSIMTEETRLGESCEEIGDFEAARIHYERAVAALFRLEKLTGEMYPLGKSDLFERIGSACAGMGEKHKAMVYYTKALEIAESELGGDDDAQVRRTIFLVLDKMGIVQDTSQGRLFYYEKMKQTAYEMLKAEDTPQNRDSVAYALYKVAIADPDHPDREGLCSARKIWYDLMREYPAETLYREWYDIAGEYLDEKEL